MRKVFERFFKLGRMGKLPLVAAVGMLVWNQREQQPRFAAVYSSSLPVAGEYRPGMPEYTRAEVAQHRTVASRIWITYKSGVYDVTNFLPQHPGGNKLLMAAGGAADPFWNLYQIHHRTEVFQMLESMRIGNLKPSEKPIALDNPYANDPERHPALKPLLKTPFNGEAPHEALLDGLITPNELFFVRNHLPVPDISAGEYRLHVRGVGLAPTKLTLSELKSKFTQHKVMVTTQCAGNRRAGMMAVAPVKGLEWEVGAISTAEWTGVLLKDVLESCGFSQHSHPSAKHVRFQGYDHDPSGPYEVSIPLSRSLNPYDEVLLAYEMNGEPIPRDHGFPVRLIVPGVAGVRNVKWLKSIEVTEEESQSVWQKRDYKVFPGNIGLSNVDFDSAPPIQELPVNSAILSHRTGDIVQSDSVELSGYAISGGGHGIYRVEVTTTAGEEWVSAELKKLPNNGAKNWTWAHWKAKVPMEGEEVTACVRAYDSSYNTQPRSISEVWNFRGLLNTSWHCVTLHKPPPAP